MSAGVSEAPTVSERSSEARGVEERIAGAPERIAGRLLARLVGAGGRDYTHWMKASEWLTSATSSV